MGKVAASKAAIVAALVLAGLLLSRQEEGLKPPSVPDAPVADAAQSVATTGAPVCSADLHGDAPPTARAAVACDGLSCRLDASGSTDDHAIAAYRWDLPDGAASDEAVVTHRFREAGRQDVRLAVIDRCGQAALRAFVIELVAETAYSCVDCEAPDGTAGRPASLRNGDRATTPRLSARHPSDRTLRPGTTLPHADAVQEETSAPETE